MSDTRITRLSPDDSIVRANPKRFYGRMLVVQEEDFYRLAFVELRTQEQMGGISTHIYKTSMFYYRELRPEWAWKQRQHYLYARTKYGNTNGARLPETLLDRADLEALQGYSTAQIAEKLETTEWFVRRSMQVYGIANTRLPARCLDTDLKDLHCLEQFAPGLTDAAHAYYEEPGEFYEHLNTAWMELQRLMFFLKEFKASYRYHMEKGRIAPHQRVQWVVREPEFMVEQALKSARIPATPQYPVQQYRFDFRIDDTPILVECDGAYHTTCPKTKARDIQKTQAATAEGFQIIRFQNEEIRSDVERVVAQIRHALSESNR